MKRKITELERWLGRSEDYYNYSAEGQWSEDKKLGILDWDGTVKEAERIRGMSFKSEKPPKTFNELKDHARKLHLLMDSPEVGLMTWREFAADHMKWIKEYYEEFCQ